MRSDSSTTPFHPSRACVTQLAELAILAATLVLENVGELQVLTSEHVSAAIRRGATRSRRQVETVHAALCLPDDDAP